MAFPVRRPGSCGRPPTVYKLGEAGAALLAANGYPQAHPCGLSDEGSIAHAQATLDVRLKALAAGLKVQTEQELRFTTAHQEERTLRPDNLVALAGDRLALFETEQAADMGSLRRIRESVENKARFFRSRAAQKVSPTVRVLINLPYGPEWEKTIATWERATAIVADSYSGKLGFKPVAIPLTRFLDEPDWGEPPDEKRWELLFDPAQTRSFGPPLLPAGQGEKPERYAIKKRAHLPDALKRRTPPDDRRIMAAYYQYILESKTNLVTSPSLPRPDPAFFEVMVIIYDASHQPGATAWQRAAYPYASIYLLRKYLKLHPQLSDALKKAVARGGGRVNWSTTLVLSRMQAVIDTFLRYHGFGNRGPFEATPVSTWDRGTGPRDFEVIVKLPPEVLMGEGSGVVPTREEADMAARALSWVLWALFSYSEALGLQPPAFW